MSKKMKMYNSQKKAIAALAVGILVGILIPIQISNPGPNPGISPIPLEDGQLRILASDEDLYGLIDAAASDIYLAMYIFSYREIAAALDDATRRGVNVSILCQEFGEGIMPLLRHCRVTTVRPGDRATFHPKMMILDNQTVVVGSHNYSYSAFTKNDEISVVVDSEEFAHQCYQVWQDWRAAA